MKDKGENRDNLKKFVKDEELRNLLNCLRRNSKSPSFNR